MMPSSSIRRLCVPPAGIRIFCSEQRSQGQNRERAMAMLRSRLYDMELEKQRAAESAKRKSQVRLGAMPHHSLRAQYAKNLGVHLSVSSHQYRGIVHQCPVLIE